MADFSARSRLPELMDDPFVGFDDFQACLVDLARVNRLTLAYRPTLHWLESVVRQHPGRMIRVVDAGAGYGDMLRVIARWAARRGHVVEMWGIDHQPAARRAALAATPADMPIHYVTGDIFTTELPAPPDLVISSLFTHHLSDAELPPFLRWMEDTATLGWFVNDLRRHPLAYHGFRSVIGLGNWHRFIGHDGAISILRGFTENDWRGLIAAAGLDPRTIDITRWFPFRLCLGRLRNRDDTQ